MGVNRANEQDAIKVMKQNIQSNWINTDMGSGFHFVLKDIDGSIIHEHKYLDIYELPENLDNATEQEKQEHYEEWKEDMQTECFQKFAAVCEVKYLYFFL